MAFEPLTTISSRVVSMRKENVDTDQIIPARFLKAVDSEGFGDRLFYDWRYLADGTANPDFVLNTPAGKGRILLTGRNFGCGSSREHAAWALYQYGFRVIISSGFADIFRNNALNNGLLPVEVEPGVLDQLFAAYDAGLGLEWTVDLPSQTVQAGGVLSAGFAINPFRKVCLIEGSDLVDYLAGLKEEIAGFEKSHSVKSL